MRSRAARRTLMGLFVVALVAASYLCWMAESRIRTETQAARDFDQAARTASRAVLDLRGAQQAYVATGQGDEFWIAKVSSSLSSLQDTLAALRLQAQSADGHAALDAVTTTLQDFEQMDRRAREYARNGHKLLASDLIFSDGFEKTEAAVTAFEQTRTAELGAREAAIREDRRRQVLAAGAAAATGLALMLALLPLPLELDSVRATSLMPAALPDPAAAPDHELRLRPALNPDAERAVGKEVLSAPATGPATVDLGHIASLCTALARIADTRALPAILERTASILDAPGIVIWIADPDGRELSPIVTHGYPPHLMTRLGTIRRDAENVTASAFRTSLVQTVPGDATSTGAIAAPLLTSAGCVGVMAAEVRHSGEKQDAKLAAATIVAAQLATLVGLPSDRAQSRPEAAGSSL
jgi:CHASE3 domain sensor protein